MKKLVLLVIALPFIFLSCNDDDDDKNGNKPTYSISLNKSETEIIFGDSENLILSFSDDAISNLAQEWSSNDTDIATVNSNGKVTAVSEGTTAINVECKNGNEIYSAKCTITVTPFYKEPCLDFGSEQSVVKAYEKRELVEEDDDFLLYEGENDKVIAVLYEFEEDGLDVSIVVFNETEEIVENLVKYLAQTYTYLGESDDYYIFYVDGKSAAVGLTYSINLGLCVIYIEDTITYSSSIESIIKSLDQKKEKYFKTLESSL